jgi:hemolysin activation/secretion protein
MPTSTLKYLKAICGGLALLTGSAVFASDFLTEASFDSEPVAKTEEDLIGSIAAPYHALGVITEQEAPTGAPLEPIEKVDEEEVLAPDLKQIRISSSEKRSPLKAFKAGQDAIDIRGLDAPGDPQELVDDLDSVLGQPLTRKVIEDIRQKIVSYYRENHRPVMMVVVPEQDISDGVLQLIVAEGVVGEVIAKGQRWTSAKRIFNTVHLNSGDPIDSDKLLTDVQWLNQNPFRQTDVVFAPGDKNGTTNVELVTKDRIPLRVYAGGDNTGTPSTGRTRLFTGLNWGNAFFVDHLLSFQWTVSDDFHKFKAYTGSYSVPLPWRHTFTVYGGYSSVRPHNNHFHTIGFKSLGWSAQASGRYKFSLGKTYGNWQQDLQFGYDFKETNNNLLFTNSSTAIETNVVRLGQFVGSYHASYLPRKHVLNFEWDVIVSPFQNWYGNQNFESYNKLQNGASPIYVYTDLGVSDDYAFSRKTLHQGWRIFYQARLQLSNKILLPSEQFSLGGYSTVRGYNERLVNYDNATCANFELKSPNFFPWKLMTGKDIHETMHALVFMDYGYGWTHRHPKPHLQHVDPANHNLLGVGFGLRYSINRYLQSRCDLGFPLLEVENNGTFPHIHFSLLLSY